MKSAPSIRDARSEEKGFILAIGLMVLAAMAILGVSALNSASFQSDVANNLREGQETYYAATVGLSRGLEQLLREYPGIERTKENGNPYMAAVLDRSTGTIYETPQECAAGDHACACATLSDLDCFDFYIEARLLKCSHATLSSADKYVSLHYRVTAVAGGFHGNHSSVAVDVAGTYPGYCP